MKNFSEIPGEIHVACLCLKGAQLVRYSGQDHENLLWNKG